MQAKNRRRHDLIEGLNRASREAAGLGVVFSEAAARAFGVNHTDFECIDIISLRGRVTAGELATATGLTTGAVTGVIDRLEAAGLARRERDPDDRRKVYVRILPKALAEGRAFYGSFEKAVNALIATYSDAEIALITGYFTRARDVILKEIEKLNAAPKSKRRPAAAS